MLTCPDKKLEYRKDFPDHVLDNFSPTKPVFIINGNVDEKIQEGSALRELVPLLTEKAIQRKKHDFVIIYNATSKNMRFGDEYINQPTKDRYMLDLFKGLNIALSADSAGSGDQLAKILDTYAVKEHGGAVADSTFLTVLEKLTEHKEKTFLVIIENGDLIFPDASNTATGASHAPLPARLKDIDNKLKGTKNRNIIVVDPSGRISGDLTKKMPQLSVPQSTEAEVRDILAEVITEPDKLIQAIRFAVTLEISTLMEIVDKNSKDVDELLRELVRLRTEKIEKMSEGYLKATIALKSDEVALSQGAKAYCAKLARNFKTEPHLVPRGILLAGPPGTGKSVYPQYIASQIGVPFLRMGSMGTEGYAGVSSKKLEAVFRAIEANKPCVVLIDEMDKAIPSENDHYSHSTDKGFMALFQSKIGDDETMNGALFFGATNNPEKLSSPITRSGRFGTVIAVLPPKTVEERIKVFRAVWKQLEKGNIKKFESLSDDFLTHLLVDLPPHITGGDFKEMIKEAMSEASSDGPANTTISAALLFEGKRMKDGTAYKKGADFEDYVAIALSKQNVKIEEDSTAAGHVELDPEDLKALALANLAGDIVKKMKESEAVQSDTESKLAELQKEYKKLVKIFDAGMRGLGEEGEKLKQQESDLLAQKKEIEAQMELVKMERVKFDEHVGQQKKILEDIFGAHRSKLIDKDRKEFEEIEKAAAEISTYNLDTIAKPESVLARIDELIPRIAQLNITIFGFLVGNKDIAKVEANLKELQAKFQKAVNAKRKSVSIFEPIGKPVTATPKVTKVIVSDGPKIESQRKGESITDKWPKIAAIAATISIGLAAIYAINSENNSTASEIITFNSESEGLEKGYIDVKKGGIQPAEGYEWAYSAEEIEKFPKGDARINAVKKINK